MKIIVNPRRVLFMFLGLVLLLLFFNIVGIVTKLYFGHDQALGLVPLFDFATEKNIPTLYSSSALMIASVLLLVIAATHKSLGSSHFAWLGLALVFLFLSIDESAGIHERFGPPVRNLLGATGLLYRAWVVPYAAALAIFVVAYFKFLIDLPRQTMILFLVSGCIFIAGAMGFEMLGGWYYEIHGRDNYFFSFLYTCEEFLEMLGVVIFIYALLSYMASQFDHFSFEFDKHS